VTWAFATNTPFGVSLFVSSLKSFPKVESFASFAKLKVLFVEYSSGEDIERVMFDIWSAVALIMDDKTNLSPCFITSGYSKVT